MTDEEVCDVVVRIFSAAILQTTMKALTALPDPNTRTVVAILDALEVPKGIAI